MPELPEVETLKRELQVLVGKKLKSATVFSKKLKNKQILELDRRAKILIFTLSDDQRLLVHLKMTGQLIFRPKVRRGEKEQMIIGGHPQDNPFQYTRAEFTFTDDSKLYFNDLRKFGWIRLLSQSGAEKILGKHGVEPLGEHFTFSRFQNLLNKYPKRKLKPFLLDQTLIAGLGNIYVDEACFIAQVLPTRVVKSLTKAEQKLLHQAIISVLKLSIAKKGTSAKNYVRSDGTRGGFVPYLKVYGRKGERCKRCKESRITKIKFAGRGTHFCQNCQK